MTDRRYGKSKYGSGSLYGATDSMTTLVWDVSFDWDKDGVFESQENSRLVHVAVNRGRQGMLNEDGVGFRQIPTGRAVIRLLNFDGRYDGWNTSSPLYPKVTYGVEVMIRVRKMPDATVYPVFRGLVTDISPSGYGSRPTVEFTILDGLAYLRNSYSRVNLIEGYGVDDAVLRLVQSSGYRWGYSVDATSETIPYWWVSGSNVTMTELESLSTSTMGYFFVDRNNRARFIARSAVHEVTTTFLQEEILRDVGNPQPFDLYRNVVRLRIHPRAKAASGNIFQLTGTAPAIPAGATLVIFLNYSYANQSCPATNVITPVATTDYLLNSSSTGGGTNLTSNCVVTLTDFGESARVTVKNTHATTQGYLIKLNVRGEAVYETDTVDAIYPDDPDNTPNRREMFLDLPWQQDINVANDILSIQGAFWTTLHPTPIIKIDNRPEKQFNIELFDIVEVNLEYLGLYSATYRVGGIEHETVVSETCQSVISTFYLEPYVNAGSYMRFGITGACEIGETWTLLGW